MKVLLVTTWGTACGIAEHSAYLKQAVEAADPEISLVPSAIALDPVMAFGEWNPQPNRHRVYDVLHLNYHAALHSRWTPERVRQAQALGIKVLITYHDTGVPNSDQCKGVYEAADAFVIHEPCEDLPKAIYWRQGIPAPPVSAYRFGWQQGTGADGFLLKRYHNQPILGSIGFPFGWKGYDLMAEASAAAGWALVLIAPIATDDQVQHWRQLNPDFYVRRDFVPRLEALQILAGCDATMFAYANCNTGTSGAIRQGIAARKPVLATVPTGCRQFRDLFLDPVGNRAIRWMLRLDVPALVDLLSTQWISSAVDPCVALLAEQDSWKQLGQRYARLYQELAHA